MSKFVVIHQCAGVPPLISEVEDGHLHAFTDCKKYGTWQDAHTAVLTDAKLHAHNAAHYLADVMSMKRG